MIYILLLGCVLMKLQLKHKRLIVLGVDLLLVLSFIILYFFLSDMMDVLPDCTLRALGFPCLGCGGTRCVKEFIHFNFIESFMLHPFIFISIILAIFFLVLCHLAWVFGVKKMQKLYYVLTNPAFSFTYLGVFIVFAILRITGILPSP